MKNYKTHLGGPELNVGDTTFTISGLWRIIAKEPSTSKTLGPIYTLEYIRQPIDSDYKPVENKYNCSRLGGRSAMSVDTGVRREMSYWLGYDNTLKSIAVQPKDPKTKMCKAWARRVLRIATESTIGSCDQYWHGSRDCLLAYLGE